MFQEPHRNKGWVEVICGSMFSGKTEELIRRLRRAQIANMNVLIFKPSLDKRYDETYIVSHDTNKIHSKPVNYAADILPYALQADVVGIDEAQFFDNQLPEVCDQLALAGVRVVVAGLDMDYLGKPFGTMPMLLATAEYITKLHAICMQCGQLASHSYRKTKTGEQIELGAKNLYEPRCRICYYKNI